MMDLLARSGPLGQAAFVLVVLGMPLLAGGLVAWFRRQSPERAALAALAEAQRQGQPPAGQHAAGRAAALRAAAPDSAAWLGLVLMAWSGTLLALALANFLGTPPLALVTDILRGRQELAAGGSAADFVAHLSRTIAAGGLASVLAAPALVFAALGYGWVHGWLPGEPLARALRQLAAATGAGAAAPEIPGHGWSATAFLTGPFWYLWRGRPGRALALFSLWLGLLLAALGVWLLVARLVWDGRPLEAGTVAGAVWHHLLPTLSGLFSLPVFLHAGIRGDGHRTS